MTTDSVPVYAPGSPMWVDLGTSDIAASSRFYSELFEWQAEDLGEQMGHYTLFRQAGKMVTAASPLWMPEQPLGWSTYVCTEDAASTAEAVRKAGGRVLAEPMAVMELGSSAMFADPAGAVFGVWQPGQHKGAELTNTPNSFCWNELPTRDLEGAKAFYPRVFGWGAKSSTMPPIGKYVEWQIDGRSVAGATAMGDSFPAQVPPHWLVWFAVANSDATVAKVQSLGGQLLSPPMEIPQGRFAVLSDPLGANFGVIKLQDAH